MSDTIPEQLFSEDDWRLLSWEVFRRAHREPEFPATEDDVRWLAFCAETAFRRLRDPVVRRLRPLVERGADLPIASSPNLAREARLLRDFLYECTNPLHAQTFERGPWVPQDELPHTDPIQELAALQPASALEVANEAVRLLGTRLWLRWTWLGTSPRARSTGGGRTHVTHGSGLAIVVASANGDLRQRSLPEIAYDEVGELVVDVEAGPMRTLVLEALSGHGLEPK